MKILAGIQKMVDIGKSDEELQSQITVTEVWHLWQTLVQKYDIIELTQILLNYAENADLRLVLERGLVALGEEKEITEKELKNYGITAPKGPPAFAKTALDVEPITDSFIFRRVFYGIQGVLPIRMQAFIDSTSPKLREIFREHMMKEIEIYDLLMEYGKFKGFLDVPPAFRI